MTDFDEFERRLAAAIRSDADESVGPYTPESIARAAIADTGPRARRVHRSSRPTGRFGRGRGMMLLAAAAVLLVGVALAGSAILRLPSVIPPVPAPSIAALASASPEATTTPEPTPSTFVPPSPPASSLDLTWTQLPIVEPSINSFDEMTTRVAWLGDRFVLIDAKSGSVRTSNDGKDWQALQPGDAAQSYVELLRGSSTSWEDTAIGWWNPGDHSGGDIAGGSRTSGRDNVQVVRPSEAPPSTTPFRGRIQSIGIGPKGIVAQVHSNIDTDRWITKKLGLRTNNDWTCCVKSLTFKDGVLELKLTNRRGLKVVWADEGLEPGDYRDGGFGWFSPDGEHWTAMAPNDGPTGDAGATLPTGAFGSVVGVSDGFIAAGAIPDGTCADPDGSCAGMWHSSDGLNWRFLGPAPEMGSSGRELCIRDECSSLARELLPWKGGALAVGGEGRVTFWTSGGPAAFPMTAQVRGTVATGPLGLVSIGDGQVVASRDGIESQVSSLPTQMGDGGGEWDSVAVGDRTVVVLVKARTGDFTSSQSLWLGTFEP
jgi:hypothetical protein